ncbi:MAG: tRNA uridine-5-carboxymethylaminomethyl(34) synthesis GTPase MnmE [Bacteroidaceae bacterium]|nr:tRNA uridine-5-carboxymethylaminomethyl(34) synthesis GTPase MnmE [Bacteroidaceae bacterium]
MGLTDAYNLHDTICAISTPAGTGGIAVLRVSGTDAERCVATCWKGADIAAMASHTAHLGQVLAADGSLIDEVVLTLFRAPHSFTGETVVELSCHGSVWVQQQLMARLVECGCRVALGGEFTRRAFANGRLDLSQAEAVADLIASTNAATHRLALSQMRGNFSSQLAQLRDQLLHLTVLMELELDFADHEELEFADRSELEQLSQTIADHIAHLADSFHTGKALKRGVPVAIVGKTNVGKSTLLNRLLHEERAIVSSVHGTTRDVIEDTISIRGIDFRFIDTAGLRATSDEIEQIGIERTRKKTEEASIVLWLQAPLPPKDGVLYGDDNLEIDIDFAGKKLIKIINKTDLYPETKPAPDTLGVSARDGRGMDDLEQALIEAADIPEIKENDVIVTSARHYEALTRAQESLHRVLEGLRSNTPTDLLAEDLKQALAALAEITGGAISSQETLTTIFSRFCIGK